MDGKAERSERAEGEFGERVRANILKEGAGVWRCKALMTARPCLPVAPVTRSVLSMAGRGGA